MPANREQIALVLSALRRKRAAKDINFFANYYLGRHLKSETPAFHKEIYSLLTQTRVGIAAPRGFAKSTIVQILRGLQVLLTGKEEDLLTISQSSTLAEEWIRKIKIELETNPRIKEDFGMLFKWGPEISKKWTESHITLDSLDGRILNQVRARGRGCQIRGFRPTRVICDDLEDDELVRSSEQRRKLADWFKGALMNTISVDQQMIVIGTLLHPLALLKEIIDKQEEFRDWTTKKYKALTNGKSIWEARWPTKELLRRKMEIGTYAFEAEYQNNPLGSKDLLFKVDWLKRHDTQPKTIYRVMVIDPASSEKESADETGIVVLGLTEDLNIYELDSISGRWGLWDLVNNFFTIYSQWQPDKVGIEKVAFQEVLKPILLKEGKKRNIVSLPIKQITVGTYSDKKRREAKDKHTRAFKVTHFFENGRIFIKSQKLYEQLITFPTGDLDDLVDAIVYGILMIDEYTKKSAIIVPRRKVVFKSLQVGEPREPIFEPPPLYKISGYDWKTAV